MAIFDEWGGGARGAGAAAEYVIFGWTYPMSKRGVIVQIRLELRRYEHDSWQVRFQHVLKIYETFFFE